MIHELRTYTFFPGKMPIYLKAAAEIGRPVPVNLSGQTGAADPSYFIVE